MNASELRLRHLWGQLRHLAPMGVRAAILQELEAWPDGASRDAWARLASRLAPVVVPPSRGRASFPVLRRDGLVEGHLASVTSRAAGLGAEDHPRLAAGAARARSWLAAFLARESGAEATRFSRRLEDLRLDLALFRPEEARPLVARDEALDLEVRGRSLELACVVALASELLGRAPCEALVLSGAASDEEPTVIAPVAGCEAKGRVCALEAPASAAFLVEVPTPLAPLLARLFGDDVVGALVRASGESSHALLGRAATAWRTRDHAEAARLARLALDGASDDEDHLAARLYLGVQQLHQGDLEAGRALLDEAIALGEALGARGETRHLPMLGAARIFLAVVALDGLRPALAMQHLEAVEAELAATPPRFRDDTWYQQQMSCLGTMDRAARGLGDLGRARDLRHRALALGGPGQRARNLLELARVALAAGEAPEARAHLEAADAALEDIAFPADRQRTERFLRLTRRAAGLLPPPTPDEVEAAEATAPDLRQWPQPAELAELLLAACLPIAPAPPALAASDLAASAHASIAGFPSAAAAPTYVKPRATATVPGGEHPPRSAESRLVMWLERYWTPSGGVPIHPAYLQFGVTTCARAVLAGARHAHAFRALAATLLTHLPASAEAALLAPLRAFAAGGSPEPVIAVALY